MTEWMQALAEMKRRLEEYDELKKKAKLYDLLNDPLLIAVPVLNHVVQDIFGFKFFMGDCTLDDVINEIDEMLQNERNQRRG